MECKECENLRWPWHPKIKNWCKKCKWTLNTPDFIAIGCNIDGVLPPLPVVDPPRGGKDV